MNKRIILIIIIIIFIVILGLAGYYVYNIYLIKPAVNTNLAIINMPSELNINSNSGEVNQNINSAGSQPAINVSKDDKSKIQLLAVIFGQNYGSYSNQTNLTNFDEIYSFMGATMKNWVQTTYKGEIMKQHPQNVYYAIQTKVLNMQITKLDEAKNTASVMLKTQRQEFVESPDKVRVYNQDLLLNLVKVNDNWIVDSAYWQ